MAARHCDCGAGEREFLEGLVVELMASRRGAGSSPAPHVPQGMTGLFQALRTRAARDSSGEEMGRIVASETPVGHDELNRELGSVISFLATLSPLHKAEEEPWHTFA